MSSRLRSGWLLILLLMVTAPGVALAASSQAAVPATSDKVIAPVAATASTHELNADANHLIDGSGLTEMPKGSGVFAHTNNKFLPENTVNMWNAGHPGGQHDKHPTLTFDVGKAYMIGSMRIWNYNEEKGWNRRSVKEMDVLASEDGKEYAKVGTFTLAKAPGEGDYAGQLVPLPKEVKARYFRFDVKSDYGGDVPGLSEVRFNTFGAGQPMGEPETAYVPVVGPKARTGVLVAPVGVEASSEQGSSPSHLIDDLGLDETPDGVLIHTNRKYTDAGTTMWNAGFPNGKPDYSATLLFDLGKSLTVDGLHVWNYNEPGYTGRSVKEVEILTSDDKQNFKSLGVYPLEKGPGEKNYVGEVIGLKEPVKARYFRFAIKSNHQGNEVPGLSKVRFNVTGGDADAIKAEIAKSLQPKYARPEHPKLPVGKPLEGAENMIFPADAGVVDVTRDPYNAKGDGVTDDTAAIQKALSEFPGANKIIYLPNGVYLISNRLDWPAGRPGASDYKNTILQGQSQKGTIVRLKDNCPGYTNPRKPKAMVWTGPAPAQRFRNAVRNLTVDTGAGNRGAVGIQFHASNQGVVRNVTIVSGDGLGCIGLDMSFSDEIGPCMIKKVTIRGFDFGIKTSHAVNSQTLEDITLLDQNKAGVRNDGQVLSIRNLAFSGEVAAVENMGGGGPCLLTLLNADLKGRGAAAEKPAIINTGRAYLRDVRTAGFARALQTSGPVKAPEGAAIDEYASHEPVRLFPSSRQGHLKLPIKETPELPWDPLDQWVTPTHFGIQPNDKRDASEAIQKAIDSGKSTLYFPNGHYRIDKQVIVRKNIRRIIGCEAFITLAKFDGGAFKIEGGDSPIVFERFMGGFNQAAYTLENAGNRTLIIQQCANVTGVMTGPGEVFIEDVVADLHNGFVFNGQNAWARQMNVELKTTKVFNRGGKLWVFGYKSENTGTLLETSDGGKSELLGILSYTCVDPNPNAMFVVRDAEMTLTGGEVCFINKPYKTVIAETRGGQTKTLPNGGSGFGTQTTMFISGEK